MNAQKYTQKSLEAVQNAQSIATEYGNQQIEQPHLLLALLLDEGGLIPQLLGNMGLTVPSFTAAAKAEVEKLPRVSGSGREQGKIYVAQDVDKCLNTAESIAASMKDEYVSVEHLLLALLDTANRELKELFRTYNVQKEGVLQALTNVRGNQRVTSDNPEETYNALKKYGSDLVERARANKLDPVIGRDDEIRNVIRILSRKSKNNPVLIGEPGVPLRSSSFSRLSCRQEKTIPSTRTPRHSSAAAPAIPSPISTGTTAPPGRDRWYTPGPW